MQKTSTTTVTFPLELLYTGRNAIQTLQNTSMLDVSHLASLKVSCRLLAGKAKAKLKRAKETQYPKERYNIMAEPLLHMTIRGGRLRMCIYVHERGRGPQPDCTESPLNQGADGNEGTGGP